MRLPRWLGGGRGEDDGKEREIGEHQDDSDLKESKLEREQIKREHIEMQARIKSLREIAEYLGGIHR